MVWIEDTLSGMTTIMNSSIIYWVLLSCLATALGFLTFKTARQSWLLNKLPGQKTVPLLGNTLDLNVGPRELFESMVGKFCDFDSSISRLWIGWSPFCLLYKARAVETVLSSQKFIEKSRDYEFLHPWLGTGLLTATGKKWHSRRKLLTPAFHFKILEDFVEIFNQQSSILVENLAPKIDGKPFDIFQYITLCTLDIILETAMGSSINAQGNSESDYVKAVYKLSEIIQFRQTRPWYRLNFFFNLSNLKKEQDAAIKVLHTLSKETIKEKRKMFQGSMHAKNSTEEIDISIGKKKKLAFLDLLLSYSEDGNALSDEDIREEVDTFMFEGHDTTAAAINWTIYLLGSHPQIQDKVYEELNSIFGDSDRQITSTDLKKMKYLECCIKEALRLYPSVPFFARLLKEDVIIDGYKVPSGTNILVVVYKLHRDPVQFPDPEEFKPERFSTENCANRHPYAYIPFSAGPRNCIGQKFAQMEEKIVIANFVRKFRVESTVKREHLKVLGELILRPEDGNFVKIFEREK